LLWRILLRLSATETGIADLYAVLSEPMCASPAGDVFLWSAAEATGLLSPRERAVLSAVDDVEAPFIEQMWDIATDGDRSGPEPVSTLSELEKLGVVAEDPSNGGRWLLQEEFSYLSAFLEHLSASSQLKKEVAAFLGTVAGKGFLDLKSGARFVQLLLDCFSHLVTGETCKTSAALLDEPLSSLHGFARFPVIPYYYWSSIDRAVKSHLVLPILESPLEKIPIHSARGSGGPNALPGFSSAYDSLPTTMSGVTLVAVLGVRPIRCLDYTMLCASGAEGTDDSGDAMRLMCIRDFAVTMGRVVADDVTAGG
jgi:predicted transcriptional regulator